MTTRICRPPPIHTFLDYFHRPRQADAPHPRDTSNRTHALRNTRELLSFRRYLRILILPNTSPRLAYKVLTYPHDTHRARSGLCVPSLDMTFFDDVHAQRPACRIQAPPQRTKRSGRHRVSDVAKVQLSKHRTHRAHGAGVGTFDRYHGKCQVQQRDHILNAIDVRSFILFVAALAVELVFIQCSETHYENYRGQGYPFQWRDGRQFLVSLLLSLSL